MNGAPEIPKSRSLQLEFVGGGQPRHASYGATKSGAASGQRFKAEEVFQDQESLGFEAPGRW